MPIDAFIASVPAPTRERYNSNGDKALTENIKDTMWPSDKGNYIGNTNNSNHCNIYLKIEHLRLMPYLPGTTEYFDIKFTCAIQLYVRKTTLCLLAIWCHVTE